MFAFNFSFSAKFEQCNIRENLRRNLKQGQMCQSHLIGGHSTRYEVVPFIITITGRG